MKKLFVSLLMVTAPLFSAQGQNSENLTFTVNGVSFSMIKVEGGTFTMGATKEQGDEGQYDEHPLHQVTLSDYYMGETEVTQELWEAVMGDNPSCFKGSPQMPVDFVDWLDCVEFITKLNTITGQDFHLPSEAQWEYAARGGKKSQGYKFSGSNCLDDVAWCWKNSGNDDLSDSDTDNSSLMFSNNSQPHLVKTKQPNELGIYDMTGNVSEWCLDIYNNYPANKQTNPINLFSLRHYFNIVYRGGHYSEKNENLHISHRSFYPVFNKNNKWRALPWFFEGHGFRLSLNTISKNTYIKAQDIIHEYLTLYLLYDYDECKELYQNGYSYLIIPSLRHLQLESWEAGDVYSLLDITDILIAAYIDIGNWRNAKTEVDLRLRDLLSNIDNYRELDYYIKKFKLYKAEIENHLANYEVAHQAMEDYLSYMNQNHLLSPELYSGFINQEVEILLQLGKKDSLYYDKAFFWINKRDSIVNASNINDIELMICNDFTKAHAFECIGELENAIAFYENVIDKCESNNLINPMWHSSVLNALKLYLLKGDKKKAMALGAKIENSQESEYITLDELLWAYYINKNNNITKIKDVLGQFNQGERNNCLNLFTYYSQSEIENLWSDYAITLNYFNNLLAAKYPVLTEDAFDNVLFTKNLALLSSDLLSILVNQSNDPSLREELASICELKNNITNYSQQNNDSISIDEMIYYLKYRESELLKYFPNYKEFLQNSFKDWHQIQKSLAGNEVAIEFVEIPKPSGGDVLYGALILSENDEYPILVNLCQKRKLDELLDNIEKAKNKEERQKEINSLYSDAKIYNLIWDKLEPYIKDKATIYFSPTGSLNFINHNVIHKSKKKLFSEDYNLVRLSSTSKIEEVKNNAVKDYDSALLYGGINYKVGSGRWKEVVDNVNSTPDQKNNQTELLLAATGNDIIERGGNAFLLNSLIEVNKIEQDVLQKELNNASIKTYREEWAVEETFKAIDHQAPSIIHFATHGKFADRTEELASNPLLQNTTEGYSIQADLLKRTYMLMAGAEYIGSDEYQKNGNRLPEGVRDDGYLTAEEISRMDLRGAKLVVMSACETGKGFESIDGIIGLQRGFKKAGAETIVMSLWTVNDESTSYLMQQFYTHLITDKMPAREALKQAQNDTRDNDEHDWKKPYFWAGFVVLD